MLNQDIMQATVVTQTAPRAGTQMMQMALFKADGSAWTGTADTDDQTANEVLMTGYTIGAGVVAVAPADTVRAAVAKLEARLAILESA